MTKKKKKAAAVKAKKTKTTAAAMKASISTATAIKAKKTFSMTKKKEESNTSYNDDLKDKTVQQQPYYQQVWNKLFGKCCPVSLNSITENAELTMT